MQFYVLECKVEKCLAAFYLNDIPVVRRGPDIGDAYGSPVNHLLKEGLNKIEMVIGPGPIPADALMEKPHGRKRAVPEEGARAWAALATYPKGAVVDGPDREELVRMEWTPEGAAPFFFPRVSGVTIDLGPDLPRRKWRDAERLTLDDAVRREVGDFIIQVHSAMVVGDFETYLKHSDTRNRETDEIYEKPAGASSNQLRLLRQDCAGDPFWGMEQVRPDTFSLRLCGQDRLIECISEAWQPVLEEIPDQEESVVRYPMMIGKSGGQWEILL